ncbi:MAG: DMT family transporter [Solirubrobacteraceae bacterium]
MNGWKITPLLCASVLWGTTGTAQALAHLHAGAPAIGAARLLSGGLALWLVIAFRGGIALRELIAPGRRLWFLGASLATAIYQAAFFAAVARTGVALGTLVALGSAPAFCGVLARELAGERLPAAWTVSTVCAVVGCVLLLAPSGHAGADPLGIVLSLVAGACYGTYTVCVKRLLTSGADSLSVLVATVSIGAALLAPALLAPAQAGRAGPLVSPAGALLVLWLGPVATAGAYTLFVRGLARVPARTAGTLSLAEPLTATILGTVVLSEAWSPARAAGGALLAAGLAFSALRSGDGGAVVDDARAPIDAGPAVGEPLTEPA